ncbi:TPA: hypothetical protein ACK3Q6_003185 [Burkholderia cepacia]|uniref:hypothetical protein n=1 Tax=Burkholderia cepacia TaxID=292 RepID=UPI001CF34455|nr:hypothetical protein [Burkholderia cepacia]MCA8358228.1 hypothetical protein [Burkholderia cepacia]HDR9759510.1 hypothetical protein [Burkholderia cepacia ATCC 25416]HDV6365801.1 hypothetical protein [Burkholderia cepacia]
MDRPTRQELDFKKYQQLTLDSLMNCYIYQKPDATEDDFANRVMRPVMLGDDRTIEDPVDILMQFASASEKAEGRDKIAKSPIGAIVVSSVYWVRAGVARSEGDTSLAWSYLADARFWCGVSISQMGIDQARERTIVKTREKATIEAHADKAKSGAAGRDKAYEPVREFAYKLAREMRPESGWQSRSQAVKRISSQTLEYSLEHPPRLKEESVERTLDKWLSNMPDAVDLFPTKKKS